MTVTRRQLLGYMGIPVAATALLVACQSQPAVNSPVAANPSQTAIKTESSATPGKAPAAQAATVSTKLTGKVTAWVPPSCYLCGAQPLWNKAHPETPLEIVKTGAGGMSAAGTAKYEATLRAGSGGPDIYQSNPDEIAKDMLHKQLYDWTDRMGSIKSGFVPAKLQECIHPKTGRIYGFPFQMGVVGMYYREDLLQKVGYDHTKLQNLSWDDYVSLGRTLKQELGIALDFGTPSSVGYFNSLLWLAGGSYTNKDGTQVTFDNDIAVDAMTKVKGLYDEGLIDKTLSFGSTDWFTATRAGKVAIFWSGAQNGGYMNRNITKPEEGQGQWRDVQLPYLVKGGPRAVNAGGSPLETPAYTQNPDLAFAVLNYSMATIEGALACMAIGTVLSWLPALQSKDFVNQTLPYAGSFHMNELWAQYATNVPLTFYYTPVWDDAQTILQNYQPKILSGAVSVKDGLKAAADEVRKANEQWLRIMQQE